MGEYNVLSLVKNEERYVFIYTDENRVELFKVFQRFARNSDLSFNWYDAAVLSQMTRKQETI